VAGQERLPSGAVEIPDVLWRQWMAADLQDVVGIHFHEMVSNDVARILYTLHKVPPDPRPGPRPPPPHAGASGTRVEATLLAPVTYHLDQAVVVRKDARRPELAGRRAAHELGHAALSRQVFHAVLAGPQDWNPTYCMGRRSRIEYYWKREMIGRSWEGFRGGLGKLLTTRTTVVLVPPTRWSLMLEMPPERVTQRQIDAFDDAIVRLGPQFAALDGAAQAEFHARHGAYEESAGP
jgi:hypothetical protein